MSRRGLLAAGLWLLALAAVAACNNDDAGAGGSTGSDAGVDAGISCPSGFAPMDGVRCVPAVAAGPCAPGTAPFVGEDACAPVGPSACAPGFRASSTGFGCEDTPPTAPCGEFERETATSSACAPVGDCAAPFPPANATLFVDAAFADAQLDATHFRKLGEAVNAAKADAVIAVSPGVYQETVAPGVPLSIVGRCPAMVELRSPANDLPGVYVARKAISVRGVTLRGYPVAAAYAQQGGNLTLEDSVVVGARGTGVLVDAAKATLRRVKIDDTRVDAAGKQGWGVAAGAKSTVSLDDVTILRGTDGIFVSTQGTEVAVRASVIARQAPVGTNRSSGVRVVGLGQITLDECVVRDVVGDGAVVADGGTGIVKNSVLRGTRVQGNLARGHGAIAFQGGTLRVTGTSLLDHESIGAVSQNDKSTFELVNSLVVGPSTSAQKPDDQLRVSSEKSGMGVLVSDKGSMRLDGVVVVRAQGFGLHVDKTTVDARRLYIVDTQRIQAPTLSYALGVLINAGTFTAEQLSIEKGVLAGISAGRGAAFSGTGVLVRDVAVASPTDTGAGIALGEGGTLDVDRLVVERAVGVGVLAVRGTEGAIRLKRSVVRDTLLSPRLGLGYGVANGAGTTVELEDSVISGSAVVGFAGVGGRGRFLGGAFLRNRVAVHVQDGSTLQTADSADELGSTEVRVSSSTLFEGNDTKIGSGAIPVPTSVLP